MNISEQQIQLERARMGFEAAHNPTKRPYLVGNGTSQRFWKKIRYDAGNRWFHPWSNKSDLEIIREWIKSGGKKE